MIDKKITKTIVFVNFSISWGGGESQHLSLAKEFIRQGHIAVIITQPGSTLAKICNKENIPFHTLSVKKLTFLSPIKLLAIRQLLKSIQPDAIILNSSLELKHFAFATSHRQYNLIYRRGFHSPIKANFINKYCFKRLNRVVAISKFVEINTLNSISHYCHHPVSIINNGITPLKSFDRPRYDKKRIVAVGRLVPYKNFDLLIKAMPPLLKTVPEAELWIIGDGEDKKKLTQLIQDLKIEHCVTLKGFREDIPQLLSEGSLLTHPATKEAFGVVFLEAMRQQLSCVTFKGHAGDEIIVNTKTGLLISPSSPEDLAQGLSTILDDEEQLKAMGEAAYQRFNNNFTIEHSVNKYLHLINQK